MLAARTRSRPAYRIGTKHASFPSSQYGFVPTRSPIPFFLSLKISFSLLQCIFVIRCTIVLKTHFVPVWNRDTIIFSTNLPLLHIRKKITRKALPWNSHAVLLLQIYWNQDALRYSKWNCVGYICMQSITVYKTITYFKSVFTNLSMIQYFHNTW